jgi:hypothetical protein
LVKLELKTNNLGHLLLGKASSQTDRAEGMGKSTIWSHPVMLAWCKLDYDRTIVLPYRSDAKDSARTPAVAVSKP